MKERSLYSPLTVCFLRLISFHQDLEFKIIESTITSMTLTLRLYYNYYYLIAFDERVTFWLQRVRPLGCVGVCGCVCVCVYVTLLHVGSRIPNSQSEYCFLFSIIYLPMKKPKGAFIFFGMGVPEFTKGWHQ